MDGANSPGQARAYWITPFPFQRVSPMTLKIDPSGSNRLIRELLAMLRLEISQQGGNVQTVLGVSRVG